MAWSVSRTIRAAVSANATGFVGDVLHDVCLRAEETASSYHRTSPGGPAPGTWRLGTDSARLRILIAEDNRDAADSLQALLEALGYRTQVVYDGESAVRAAMDWRPDAVIMDIGLPGISGYDAARQIRAQEIAGRVLIIALIGWGQESDRQQSAAAGIDHHLVKPLDLAVLRRLLDS